MAYYNDMLYAAKKADSIILDFNNKFDQQQLERHQGFIDETFGSSENLKKYMDDERQLNRDLFMTQVQSIKRAILVKEVSDSTGLEAKYERTVVPTYTIEKPIEELGLNYLKTKYILSSADESIYIAGHLITDSKLQNTEVAIAKLNQNNEVLWLKNFDFELDSAGVDANPLSW
jgi:hypothetical protein